MDEPACSSCSSKVVLGDGVLAGTSFLLDVKLDPESNEVFILDLPELEKDNGIDGYVFLCWTCLKKLSGTKYLKPKPKKICNHCRKSYFDMNGFEGELVDDGGKATLGYGSGHDGDIRKFDLQPGWYCHECLDALIINGKSSLIRTYF